MDFSMIQLFLRLATRARGIGAALRLAVVMVVACGILGAADAPGSIAELEASIRQRIAGAPGSYAVGFEDLSSGQKLLVNAEERTHAASLMKVPVMMTVFHLAERGELDLEQRVVVKNRFASLVDGSPFEVEFDPNGPLAAKAGEAVPLLELVRLMITRSDNVATDLVMELVGADHVMDWLGRLGIPDIVVRRGVEDPKAYEAGLNNECSARGMLAALVACRNSEMFRPESRRHMMAILRAQEVSSMIGRGIPADSGAVVAHKTGSISWVEHDAGIVELPDGRAYGLVILTFGFGENREKAMEAGAAISQMVYRYVASR
jgi:beta-lactamase class A